MKAIYDCKAPEFVNRVGELAKYGMNHQEIADNLGITVETFRKYVKSNPDIGHLLALWKFRRNEPLCDIEIPDEELLLWMLDLCVHKQENAKSLGLTKKRITLWAKKNRFIKRVLKTSKSWIKLQERDKGDRWI